MKITYGYSGSHIKITNPNHFVSTYHLKSAKNDIPDLHKVTIIYESEQVKKKVRNGTNILDISTDSSD